MNPVNRYAVAQGAPLDLCADCAAVFPVPLDLAAPGGPGLVCLHCRVRNPDPTPPALALARPAPVAPDPPPFLVALHPDRAPESFPLPGTEAERRAALEAVLGGAPRLLPRDRHGLPAWDVYVAAPAPGALPNPRACTVVGVEEGAARAVRGPLALVPLVPPLTAHSHRRARVFFEHLLQVMRAGGAG